MGPIRRLVRPTKQSWPTRQSREGDRMIARKLSMLGTLAAALLASTAALAQVSDDVVKIGVLTDMNGPASTPTGQGWVAGGEVGGEDFGGKGVGKAISGIVGGHQLKADIGASIA